ncbi:SARP family transcriptional regulator [Microtetraspora sp. NBRC 13810]|uniref:AfsR/SARP family transcriptional regulator n=1 Tax=Microtetraspora sp. NBRC 13810 TaxID=3030990 RepID=UPI0024A5181A|nr:BTAD domain-containing putative transcriptional regulator [Microtetraspora sp. NBRC 13810]GLW05923.1 SARP family transcriptional regulator [Microtetraspora sp. NBRC 13810]
MVVDRPTFNVLGPLQVRSTAHLGGTKPRMLLATLLLNANSQVSVDVLVEALWPANPPRSAVANVRTYASALRGAFAAAGVEAGVLTGQSGYTIELPPEQLDLLVFQRLTAEARRDGGPEALGLFERALALWRGAPLADLPGSALWDARLQPLAEARLAAAEDLVALLMARGRHSEAIAELRGLLVEHPFREGLWRRLMLALHHSGRQAEALLAYATIRERLVAELGVEPGPGLREAHTTILTGTPHPGNGQAASRPHDPDGGPVPLPYVADGWRVPYQLPADVPDFTGRAEIVALLTEALVDRPGEGTPVVAVVTGPPGVGKSALAVHCAHAVRPAYRDGQLYLDLGGTTAAPPDPGDLLAEALRSLGAGAGMPDGVRERSALYRSLLADRQLLVLLDDAASAGQVEPLLPGSGCAVLVTSRRRITELPATVRVALAPMPPSEAGELLGRVAGAGRLAGEEEAVADILRACGHLPLAIRVAGARLAARPGWSARTLACRLAEEPGRLAELRAGDLEVRARFESSFRLLPEDPARTLDLLGHLGESFPGWVIGAALGGHGGEQVADALVDAHLLEPVAENGLLRYRLHGLTRSVARERVDPGTAVPALARVLGAWLANAEHAMARLPTQVFSLVSATAPRWEPARAAAGDLIADPLAWFDAERDALAEAVRLAATAGMADSAWGLAAALVPYYDLRSHHDAWRRTHTVALGAVRRAGDRYGEAALLRGLAQLSLYQDDYAESGRMFLKSHMIFRELGDRRGEAIAICGRGAVSQFLGRHVEALGFFRQALGMFVAGGDTVGEAFARQALGRVCLESGDLPAAFRWLREALRLARELGDRHREACVCTQFGRLHHMGDDARRAMRFQGQALEIFEDLGDSHCAAYALRNLGRLQAERGRRGHASVQLERSLTIFRRLGDRLGEASTTQMLGELHREAGDTALARNYLRHALTLRRELQTSRL